MTAIPDQLRLQHEYQYARRGAVQFTFGGDSSASTMLLDEMVSFQYRVVVETRDGKLHTGQMMPIDDGTVIVLAEINEDDGTATEETTSIELAAIRAIHVW